MKKLRIAQIGIGHNHGAAKMLACRKFPEIYDVVGFAESDEAWVKRRGNDDAYKGLIRYSEQEILSMSDLDAILVETDVWNLDKTAKKCLERGFHVHMDKPAGEDLGEYANILSVAKEKGLVVQLGYMYRQNPAVKKALEIINNGALGDIISIDAVMNTDHPAEYRKWLENFKGGTMYIFGCHLIDVIFSVMGKPKKVTPYLKKTGFDGNSSFDNDLAVLEYPFGFSTVKTSSVEVNGYGRRQIVINGTKGTIEIKPIERPTRMYLSLREKCQSAYLDCREEIIVRDLCGEERYDEMMFDFAAFVRGEKENPYTYEYELELQKLILSACNITYDPNEEIKI